MQGKSLSDYISENINLNAKQQDALVEMLCAYCQRQTWEIMRRRVQNVSLLPNYGIFTRVMIRANSVDYCAGQSYLDEIRVIRKTILAG